MEDKIDMYMKLMCTYCPLINAKKIYIYIYIYIICIHRDGPDFDKHIRSF